MGDGRLSICWDAKTLKKSERAKLDPNIRSNSAQKGETRKETELPYISVGTRFKYS